MRIRLLALAVTLAVASVSGPSLVAQTAAPARRPDVIYVPTPQPVVEAMLQVAGVTKNDVVYDLGSGDGRIPVTAALKYGARGVGIDIDPERIAEANENVAKNKVGNLVKIVQGDLFKLNGNIQQRILARHFEHFVRGFFDDTRPGIVILIHPMAEAHQPAFTLLHAFNKRGNISHAANVRQHLQYRFIRAAMQRTIKCSRGSREGCVGIGIRTRN